MRGRHRSGAPAEPDPGARDDSGALNVLRSLGKSVPHDLGLVTFDNDYAAQSSSPPLTTVEQPSVEQGRRMVDVLLHLIDGGTASQVTMMPTRVIERGSE